MLTTYSNMIAVIVLTGFMLTWILAMTFNIVSDILLSTDRCSNDSCRRLINIKKKPEVVNRKMFCSKSCKESYFYLNERV